MAITMGVNKSPFAGKRGAKLLTGRNIRDRLAKELETNVAMRVEDTDDGDTVLVLGPRPAPPDGPHRDACAARASSHEWGARVSSRPEVDREDRGRRSAREPFELVDI